MQRSLRRLLTAALLGLALVLALTGPAEAAGRRPDRIELPVGFRPEGIAIGPRHQAYFGSLANGDIYRADLRTGRGRVISRGPGTPSVGLKLDGRGRLWVAGGPSGTARVVCTRTGRVLATYRLATAPTFVNDVVLTRTAAWFTDSRRAQLYRVPLTASGPVAKASRVRTVPLRGDWVQSADPMTNNANGISTTPNGRSLLVVQSNTGFLFRVSPGTGRATRVALGAVLLTNGDGLLRRGRLLYVVQNQLNLVTVLRLSPGGTRGRLLVQLTTPDFDVPTTLAASGHSLYLPNARFSTPPTPQTRYWVTRIPRL